MFLKVRFAAIAALTAFASPVAAVPTFDAPIESPFVNIESSGVGSEISIDPYASEFRARFEDLDGARVRLLISSLVDPALTGDAHVGAIYVDSGGLFGDAAPNDGNLGRVEYRPASGGLTLPQGGALTPAFAADFGFERRPGAGNAWAVQSGETFGVVFDYAGGASFADLAAGLISGLVRVGLHVRSIDVPGCTGCSDALVTGAPTTPSAFSLGLPSETPAVPLPATLPLAAAALAALGLHARRRRAAR